MYIITRGYILFILISSMALIPENVYRPNLYLLVQLLCMHKTINLTLMYVNCNCIKIISFKKMHTKRLWPI